MEEEELRALREHRELIVREVVEHQRTVDVIYEMGECGMLNQHRVSYLMDVSYKSNQMRQLLQMLEGCGEGSFVKLMEVLQKLGMRQLVHQVVPESHPFHITLRQGENIGLEGLYISPNHNLAQGSHQLSGNHLDLPTLPKRQPQLHSGSPAVDDSTFELNSNDDGCKKGPIKIAVVPSREIGGKRFGRDEVYLNQSEPRGLVFLANYKNFAFEEQVTREGSELDVKNLTMLFTQMGYKVKHHINMTKYKTIQALREFRNLEEHKDVHSCIVVFMSHGRDDKSFYTSDNQHLSVNDVVQRFSNRECPLLKGKPKIFIFQYCRGMGPDVGVDTNSLHTVANMSPGTGLSVVTDSSSFGKTIVNRDPTFTDMYIVYSTIEGFASFRHLERGSWLMEAICEVFMKDSCDLELDHLMKRVSRRVRQNYTTEGNKQACEFVQLAFDKHFFFNPPQLEKMNPLNLANLGHALPHLSSNCSPVAHRRRRKPRVSSRPTTPDLVREVTGARSRNPSGASSCSEKSPAGEDIVDHSLWEAHAIHPRVRSLSATRRRASLPEPPTAQGGMARVRSFSELNSQGTSPEPSEAGELGAVGWASNEVLLESPQEDSQYLCGNNNNGFTMGGAWSRSEEGLLGATAKESFTVGLPIAPVQENFPLIHSQSALEHIEASELGGLTGVGPEMNGIEEGLRPSIKRQLSVPSNQETLKKVNDLRHYLQINDSDPKLIQPLQRIESFINKKKNENKRRRKGEPSSLEY